MRAISNIVLTKKLANKLERWYGDLIGIKKERPIGDIDDILSLRVTPAWYCNVYANRLCSTSQFEEIIDYAMRNGAAVRIS